MTERSDRRQGEHDNLLLKSALRQHGRYAAARLCVQRQWAEVDYREALEAGNKERADDKRRHADRLDRVIRLLALGEKG